MNTKAEAMKRLDELEGKVEVLAKEQAEEIKDLRKANEDLKHQAKAEYDRAENLLKQRDRLQYTLNGYADLGKALAKIRGDAVDLEAVRKVVQEELEKKVPSTAAWSGAEGLEVTESVPNVNLNVSKPWLTLDETTMEGRISVLALGGKLPEKAVLTDILQALEVHYGWRASGGKSRNRVKDALDQLVGKYKLFDRTFDGHNKQYVYAVRKDAESRVKESETREAAEAKE